MSKGFFDGLIFGGAYFPRGLSLEGSLRPFQNGLGLTIKTALTVHRLIFGRACYWKDFRVWEFFFWGWGGGGLFSGGLIFITIFFFLGGGGLLSEFDSIFRMGYQFDCIPFQERGGHLEAWRAQNLLEYATPLQPPFPRNKSAASDHSLSVWYASQGISPCLVPLFKTQRSNSLTIHRVRNEGNHKQDRDFDTWA